jgi:Flp pilus assembly protein TadG
VEPNCRFDLTREKTMKHRINQRGSALLEVALTLPLLLLICVGIFEFGRAYQTQQVLTNAAREGARIAILPGQPTGAVQARVTTYATAGQIAHPDTALATVTPTQVSIGGGQTASGSKVTVSYPFSFMVLQPIARLVVRSTTLGNAFTMTTTAEMRNEQ